MRTSIGMFLLLYVVVVICFNNCSGVHEGNSAFSSRAACNLILKDEFANGYHHFLNTNCKSCHISGGAGNGPFADPNVDVAFEAFNVRGNFLVGTRAQDAGHQPPFSGPQHAGSIENLDAGWQSAKTQADICIANAGGDPTDGDGEGIIPDDPVPTMGIIETHVRAINPSVTRKTLTWNLANQIKTPQGLSFVGAELSIDVQATTTISGEKSYIFLNPKLKTGAQALHFMYIDFKINNQIVTTATSYHSINRRVPANSTRDLAASSTTFVYDVKSTDTLSLSIGLLEPITFTPPTFAELIAPTGVLGANCLSCHSGPTPTGGWDMSTRALVIQNLMVAPYSPNSSEIFVRMNSLTSPMPQSGLLPKSDIDQVLFWIQDGAP